ncbi:protoporphyrinogen oxidase, partial [Reticulomyxa filosa]
RYNVPSTVVNSKKFDAFGVLSSSNSIQDPLLGVIFHSSVFPQLNSAMNDTPELRLVFMLTQNNDNDDQLIAFTQSKLCQMFNVDPQLLPSRHLILNSTTDHYVCNNTNNTIPLLYSINRLPQCIQHYSVGHLQKKDFLQNHILNPALVTLVGGGYDGVGIPNNIFSAYTHVQNFITNTQSNPNSANLTKEL